MKTAVGICLMVFFCAIAIQGRQNRDPNKAELMIRDIPLFWPVYDSSTPETLAANLEKECVEKRSQGVQDFIPFRIQNGENLAKHVLLNWEYYEGIRASSMLVLTMEPQFRAVFRRLKETYPDATFPPVYFVIGARYSGGTSNEHGLIIHAEMFAKWRIQQGGSRT
jgi:hypothetical protein